MIVGLDPGKTTGMVAVNRKDRLVGHGEALNYTEIESFLLEHMPSVVVVEDFIVKSPQVEYRHPLTTIGAIEYMAERMQFDLVVQSPSILSLMMKRVKGVHQSPHVRSAYAHVLYYLKKHNAKTRFKEKQVTS